jgi:DNA-binding GntR family transcriptional regulator
MKQFFTFDRRKKEPITDQIVDQTISFINDFKLIHGTPLPDLEEAKIEFGLSDTELQSILSRLLQRGYVIKDSKTGHYLVQKSSKDTNLLVEVSPIFRSIQQLGMHATIKMIKEEVITTSYELAALTGFQYEEKVLKQSKLYLGDDVPIVYAEIYFSLDKLPNLEKYLIPTEPHQDILFKQFPSSFKYHVRELNVVYTPEEVKKILNIKEEGSINTLGKYQFYNALGQVVEFGIVHLTKLNDFQTTIIDLSTIRL